MSHWAVWKRIGSEVRLAARMRSENHEAWGSLQETTTGPEGHQFVDADAALKRAALPPRAAEKDVMTSAARFENHEAPGSQQETTTGPQGRQFVGAYAALEGPPFHLRG